MDIELTLQEAHQAELKRLLHRPDGTEAAAYVLYGMSHIAVDPWSRQARLRLTSFEIVPIPSDDAVSASERHITWRTGSYVSLCRRAADAGLLPGIVHSHPGGFPDFSTQDDRNERELFRLARNRNGDEARLLSLLLIGKDRFRARLWGDEKAPLEVGTIRSVGTRLIYTTVGAATPDAAFDRQARAFGAGLNSILRGLRVGVVGCGGTGSATAMLLARLGVGQIALFDEDIVEVTNLNRLHGARRADADAMRPKVEVVAREISELGLGVRVRAYQNWVEDSSVRDALKACDVIFGCTDDHGGRLFLNRFAHFYLIPVIDMGLAIEPSPEGGLRDMSARVTVLTPGAPCLMCRGVADARAAGEEALRRNAPAEYERQKREAYVRGGGDPAPAVVTFTTEAASMAVNELLQGLVDYRGEGRWAWQRVRRLDRGEERRQGAKQRPDCPICDDTHYWGLADVEPFLDRIG
ncbi:ThiF family adenylyltransferase [Paracoccus sp. MKU1]|uniref:ThiF family adenylyltransferase n=1 Tax=Paracoccus sp. MKU1 TaxID=1745182 RepID=UPI0007191AA9|nr:ThiF family adenylyltransferase [Paracoccus sp. MKU1]KRW98053.1 thiamine biosynthesis protein ThiF [Paracoccus sp. MKU1]